MGRCSWRRSGRKSRTQDPHSLAVNRPSTSPPSPPPNPARPSFLRRALYGSCGCDSLPVRSTRRSNKDASLSVSLPSQCFQQSTANTSAHRHPSPAITEHTASSPRSTSPRHGKRVAKRPTFLPVSRNCLRPSDPRLCYSVLSLSPSPLRAVFCHQPPTASVARLLLSPRQFPGRLVPPRSISYSAPRLHFLPSTILSCDKVQLCDFGICTPPQSGRLRCDSASCLFPPRLRRNTS